MCNRVAGLTLSSDPLTVLPRWGFPVGSVAMFTCTEFTDWDDETSSNFLSSFLYPRVVTTALTLVGGQL